MLSTNYDIRILTNRNSKNNQSGDGYSLLLGAIGSLAIHAVIPAQKPPCDLMTALTGVSLSSSVPLAIAVRSDLPADSVAELVKLGKAGGKALTYGSAGNGSTQHMTGEYFQQTAGMKLMHIPYKGSAPAVADLLGGQIDLVFETLPTLAPQLSGGKLRILALTSDQRSDLLPGVKRKMRLMHPQTWDAQGWTGRSIPCALCFWGRPIRAPISQAAWALGKAARPATSCPLSCALRQSLEFRSFR